MHPALRETAHRPWQLPKQGWRWRQSWLDLAFIHFRADASALQSRLPTGVRVQVFDATAWVGLVPFRMHGVTPRVVPPLFGRMRFPELNLRTYVEAEGKPGVWFFSLDADNLAVVAGGRTVYGLPYFRARMSHLRRNGWIEFDSVRADGRAKFAARFRGVGEPAPASRGTFEHWIAERYCLYSGDSDRGLRRVDVHHAPWPMQAAEVQIERNDMLEAARIEPLDRTPVCHYSSGVHVVSFPPARVAGGVE